MEKRRVEALEELVSLQKEQKDLKELIENKRILVNGVYRDYFREKRTTQTKPGYAEIVFVPCLFLTVAIVVAISSGMKWLILGACGVILPIIALFVYLRRKERTRWEKIKAEYEEECARAREKLETVISPAMEALRKYLPEECETDAEKAEELLRQVRSDSYKSELLKQSETKTCAFCGTENPASSLKCENCGAPFGH